MGMLELASNASISRGYDYFRENRIFSYEKIAKNSYSSKVKGNDNNVYDIVIDLDHPRKSSCNCPFAKDRHVICKHQIALFFTIFPEEAEKLLAATEEYEAEEARREQEHYDKLLKYVNSLSKAELRNQLFDALCELEDYKHRHFDFLD